MKKLMIYLLIVSASCTVISASGQTTNTAKPAPKKSAKPAATNSTSPPKELTIQLFNDCKKDQMVYQGPKKDVFHGKYQQVGGASNNTIYVKSGDVICIMKDKKSVKACADVKTTTMKIEINESGNDFVKK